MPIPVEFSMSTTVYSSDRDYYRHHTREAEIVCGRYQLIVSRE
jgi:hypothetical protein